MPETCEAIIQNATYMFDPESGEQILNDWGKPKIKVTFRERDTDREWNRTYAESFKEKPKKSGGGYADYANLVEAATGVKCGEPHQAHLKPKDLVGYPVQIVKAESANINPKSKRPYINIVDVLNVDATPAPKGDRRFPVGPLKEQKPERDADFAKRVEQNIAEGRAKMDTLKQEAAEDIWDGGLPPEDEEIPL